MDDRELREAWHQPCSGVIPFDDLMNVPAFGYYVDLTPIEAEAHGVGVFASWEDRFGHALTRGPTLHLVRGSRIANPTDGPCFVPFPLELPLLPGKTVRECVYKFLDNGLLNGVVADSSNQEALDQSLEPTIDDASRLVSLVSLVNRRLAYQEEFIKYFEPLQFGGDGVVLRPCRTLQI